MKICHSAALLKPSVGIKKQMEIEYESANQLGLDWDVVLFLPRGYKLDSPIIVESTFVNSERLDSFIYKIYAWIMLRVEYYVYLLKRKDDIILTRYSVHDVCQLLFLLLSKKTYLVHHTLEEPELKLNTSLIGKIRYIAEKIVGRWNLFSSTGIVSVTNEISEYEISRVYKQKKYIFPNGILVNTLGERKNKKEGVYKLLFVASEFVEWHGLDLLLSDLASNNRQDIELHIVGYVFEKDYQYIKNDNRVVLHGVKNSQYIYDLSEKMDLALGSFALYRKNMYEACTLKVREYLSLGLPVYAGHKDVFDENFPYYQIGEPIIDQIVSYAKDMRVVDMQSVVEASIPYIDKRYLLKKLYIELTSS